MSGDVKFNIRRVRPEDKAALLELSLLAWEPIFTSFEQILGSDIGSIVCPEWRSRQHIEIAAICDEPENTFVWVAEREERAVGFVSCALKPVEETGEVQYLAVHPDHQNIGIGASLNKVALQKMQEMGMKIAVVSTGGDPSHAPARRAYEKSGYVGLPLVRYYKKL
ncbi:MAG: Acetyltransferase family [Capsulimonas sp.]|nr:Acetyltransferase family [Capsulimonas sp.]